MTPVDYISLFIITALFGFTIKLADLVNEHGLRLFIFDSYIFGVAWGMLGSLVIVSDVGTSGGAVSNAILAMILAFIVQLRIDYLNHAIGTVMIIITFLATSALAPKIFFVFFTSFVFFGALRAYLGDVRKQKDIWYRLSEPGWAHYYIVPFLWSVATGDWLVFVVFAIYRSCYNIAKYGLYRVGAYSRL
ncbi:MAG: hypothetical protein AAB482_03750 [Patescibacteria group bacterium]